MIDVTLGEYIPEEGSEHQVDFDVQGLINWARTRFGVELTPAEVQASGSTGARQHARTVLAQAAERRIEETDLAGVEPYLVEN
jgi:hypothetical protein